MLPAFEPHRLMSWLLNSVEAHSQCLLFLRSTDECEHAIRCHRNHYHELIVQTSAKTLGSCNRRAQIKFALQHNPQGGHTARREIAATAMSHTNFCSTKASYLHAYGAVMTNDCEVGQFAINALLGMRKQQVTSARPGLVMCRTALNVSFRHY